MPVTLRQTLFLCWFRFLNIKKGVLRRLAGEHFQFRAWCWRCELGLLYLPSCLFFSSLFPHIISPYPFPLVLYKPEGRASSCFHSRTMFGQSPCWHKCIISWRVNCSFFFFLTFFFINCVELTFCFCTDAISSKSMSTSNCHLRSLYYPASLRAVLFSC